ncbi:hypothetical protein FJY71_09015, partial [candidate division WOR-3 bacterium]|nr:hypothetical protein [candidate division WOR-3 bacterium]
MPSRRHPFGWYVAVAGLVALAGLGFVFRQGIGRFVARRAIAYFAPRAGLTVAFDSISGDIYTGPTFHRLRLSFNGDSLSCRRFQFSYDPLGFVGGRVPLSEANIVEPELHLALPRPAMPAGAGRPASFPRLNLKRLTIGSARVFVNGEKRVDSLDVELGAVSQPERLRAELVKASALLTSERLRLKNLSAVCVLTPDTLALERMTAITAMSRVSGDLKFALDGTSLTTRMENLSVDLGEFTPYPGRVRAKGRFQSREPGGRSRKAELEYEATGLVLGTVELPDVRGSLSLEDSSLAVRLAGESDELGEFSLAGNLDLVRQTYAGSATMAGVRVRRLAGALPDVRLDGRVGFSGRGAESLEVELHASVADLEVDSLLLSGAYRGGRVEVERLETRGGSGRVFLGGFYDRGSFAVQGFLDSADLGLIEPFAGVRVAGRAGGVFSASGSLDSLVLSGGIRLTEFAAGPVSFERGLAEFDLTATGRFTGHAVVGCENAAAGNTRLTAA